eukprot:gene25198-biopygen5987
MTDSRTTPEGVQPVPPPRTPAFPHGVAPWDYCMQHIALLHAATAQHIVLLPLCTCRRGYAKADIVPTPRCNTINVPRPRRGNAERRHPGCGKGMNAGVWDSKRHPCATDPVVDIGAR